MHFTPKTDREMAMLVGYLGGATLEQIGQEFGLTRERIRQLLTAAGCNKAALRECGIKTFGNKRGCKVGREKYRQRLANKRATKVRQKARRKMWVDRLKALAVELGRTPTLRELATAHGLNGTQESTLMTQCFATRTIGPLATPYSERTKRLYRGAGMTPWGSGTNPGNADHKARRGEVVAAAKLLAAGGKRPSLMAIGRAVEFARDTASPDTTIVSAFRSRGPNWYRIASRRLYRAAGLDGIPSRL